MRSALAAVLLGALALAGCSDDSDPSPPEEPQPQVEPTVDVDDAPATYDPLVADVVDAVAGVSVPGTPDGDPGSVYYDGEAESCFYASVRYEFDAVFGDDPAWDDVRAAVEDVVEPEGFELTEQLDRPGGFNGFDAISEDGTVLEVRSKIGRPSTLSLDAPVTGSCD